MANIKSICLFEQILLKLEIRFCKKLGSIYKKTPYERSQLKTVQLGVLFYPNF
jgi:hypothetical protein